MSLAKSIIEDHKRLKSKRLQWEDNWRDVNFFVMPNKNNVQDFLNKSKGESKFRGNLYDSSAIHFNELLASALHSMLTNPAVQWFELTTGDREIDKLPEVKNYLQKLVRKIHQVLNNSNFQTEIHEVYLDLGSMGTGVIFAEKDKDLVIRFSSRPVYEYWVQEDEKGMIEKVNSEKMMTKLQLAKRFPNANLESLKNVEEDKELKVIHSVFPREDRDVMKANIKTNMKYASVYVLEKEELVLDESGFKTFPFSIPRWIKITGEVYGRSPSMKALPDIKMLNTMMRTFIRAAQKVVDPPLMVPDDGFLGRVNTTPGGINSYRAGTKDVIFPLETKGQLGIGLEILEDARERIKKHYFIDQLQLKDGPQMTATEVNQRVDEHLRLLGPILGRLHFELLGPLIIRIIDIMKDANELPDNMPGQLADTNLDVFFSSQIAKAQRMGDARTLGQFMEVVAGMAQFDPSVLDNISMDELLLENAELYGVSQEILRTSQDREELRGARQNAQAQQEQMLREQHEAEVANKSAPAVKALKE
jgi:hypothetical protein